MTSWKAVGESRINGAVATNGDEGWYLMYQEVIQRFVSDRAAEHDDIHTYIGSITCQ